MFMLLNKKPYTSSSNDVKMWVLEEKIHFYKYGYRILF